MCKRFIVTKPLLNGPVGALEEGSADVNVHRQAVGEYDVELDAERAARLEGDGAIVWDTEADTEREYRDGGFRLVG